MIKARFTKTDGQPMVLLGLTGENVMRLTEDKPILLDLADVDPSAFEGDQ